MIKRFSLVIIFLFACLFLAACSTFESATKTEKKKGGALEVSIEKASYIWTEESGDFSEDAKEAPLEVVLNIKNRSKSTLSITPRNAIFLYDGDNQLAPIDIYGNYTGIGGDRTSDINPGKSTKMTFYFNVEKGKKYELGIKPMLMDPGKEPKEVVLTLDTNKYSDSYEKLAEPIQALSAFIDTVFLKKENKAYDKLVAMNQEAAIKEAKDYFKETLNLSMFKKLTEKDIDKAQEEYISLLNEKASYTISLVEFGNDKATVRVEYETIPLNDLYQGIFDYSDAYREKTGNYDTDKSYQYAFSKIDDIMGSISVKKGTAIDMNLMAKDGKWEIDQAKDYPYESLFTTFGSGKIY